MMPKSLICALPTPFDRRGQVDCERYVNLIKHVLPHADGLLALGTTAEAQLLTDEEKITLLTTARRICTLPLIAGIEQPSTVIAAKEAERYAKLEADMLLIAPPSFCKCTEKGYVRHVEEIIKASGLPVMLYNIPSRAGYSLSVNAIAELKLRYNVHYVKDSCISVDFMKKIRPYADVMCGSDEKLDEYLSGGADGVVSVVGNFAPKLTRRVLDNGIDEDKAEFSKLARLAAMEINPIAIKYMLYKAGIFETYSVRLPLTSASKQTREEIDRVINPFLKG